MQFQYNSDYPGISGLGHPPPTLAQEPREFPPAQPIPCARITTRIFHPNRNQVATVENVLVRTMMSVPTSSRTNNNNGDNNTNMGSDSDDSGSSTFGSDDDSMNLDAGGEEGATTTTTSTQQQHQNQQQQPIENAYWVQRTIREAIYGRVLFAVVLKRRSVAETAMNGAEWEVTTDHCAVKEMSWQHIRKERDRLAEDPIKEVSAMQFLKQWFQQTKQLRSLHQQQQQQQASSLPTTTIPQLTPEQLSQLTPQQLSQLSPEQQLLIQQQLLLQQQQQQQQQLLQQQQQQQSSIQQQQQQPLASSSSLLVVSSPTTESFIAMKETNIMMPLDLLSDDRNLYSIMPYCDGGELFERLDLNERFSEGEARYWMDQVLNGIENLQHCGICHRDMSLENLLVHKDGALIIDMGMCLMVPLQDVTTGNPASIADVFSTLSMNGVGNNSSSGGGVGVGVGGGGTMGGATPPPNLALLSGRARPRYMMRPQGTCGKWIYMSPEVYQNSDAFDGYAVDMWAAGVILFLMLTGFPPWERACQTDERFKYMTAGYLVQMLTEWELGLSSDAMDLLQRMLFLDPKDRLSLDQVRAHPWMSNGLREAPLGLNS